MRKGCDRLRDPSTIVAGERLRHLRCHGGQQSSRIPPASGARGRSSNCIRTHEVPETATLDLFAGP